MLGDNRVQIRGFLNRLVNRLGRVDDLVDPEPVALTHDQLVKAGNLSLRAFQNFNA